MTGFRIAMDEIQAQLDEAFNQAIESIQNQTREEPYLKNPYYYDVMGILDGIPGIMLCKQVNATLKTHGYYNKRHGVLKNEKIVWV